MYLRVKPMSAIRFLCSSVATTFLMAPLKMFTISLGVPAGAAKPREEEEYNLVPLGLEGLDARIEGGLYVIHDPQDPHLAALVLRQQIPNVAAVDINLAPQKSGHCRRPPCGKTHLSELGAAHLLQ